MKTSTTSIADKSRAGSTSSKVGAMSTAGRKSEESVQTKPSEGSMFLRKEQLMPGWKFVHDGIHPLADFDADRKPPRNMTPVSFLKVLKAVAPRLTHAEVAWVLDVDPNQSLHDPTVTVNKIFEAVKDFRNETGVKPFDPVSDAFKMVCSKPVGSNGREILEVDNICRIYETLGFEGISPKLMQEVIETLGDTVGSTDPEGFRQIDLSMFRKLCAFENDREDNAGMHSTPADD
mmetsp:Transcript_35291/g.79663  ORF Transcript_35291/g.79663 Transcript_35291/m.79663 type:complete len:233 (+) Transcript_35291:79-777(+)